MKKKSHRGLVVTLLMLILALSVFMTACGPKIDPGTDQSNGGEEPAKKLKVALVLPGSINDEGFNAVAYRGLMRIEDELGFDVSFTENTPVSDFTQVFRGYAESGYDLVIGHGFQFFDPAAQINEEFPEVFFATTTSTLTKEPNILAIDISVTQAGFLNGVIAAKMTKTGVLGTLAVEIPGGTNFNYGFEEGAKYVNPDIKVLSTYVSDFGDVTGGKEIALSMIAEGADVLSHNADQAAVGAFQAVNETDKEVYILGAQADQRSLAPDKTLVSAIVDIPQAMVLTAIMASKGELGPNVYVFGIAEGSVYLTDYLDIVPQDVRDFVSDVIAKIESGELVVEAPKN